MATRNNLYPIFLKLQRLNVLIVGGGSVGLEKLSFLLKSSPDARVTLVAKEIAPAIRNLALHSPEAEVTLRQKPFEAADLQGHDLVIAATNDRRLNERVRREAKRQGLLVNVADTPDLCDFYLGAIVTKGHLKVAISTNGQSPTFAKRFRQLLESALPDNIHDLLSNLHALRARLQGDFAEKVRRLDALTQNLVN